MVSFAPTRNPEAPPPRSSASPSEAGSARRSVGARQQHATMSFMERLEQFYAFYAPDRVASAPLTLQSYEGREELMFRALEKKYGPEQAAAQAAASGRGGVVMAPSSSSLLAMPNASSPQTAGDRLLTNAHSPPQPPEPPSFPPLHLNPHRNRLERFYQHYAPDKLGNVEAALNAYQGREEVMFRVLEKKYGPEPRAFIIVSPRKRGPERGGAEPGTVDAEEEEHDAFRTDPKVVGASAGPDPRSIYDHTPYDYAAILQVVGCRSDHIPRILAMYGEDKAPYAAAVAVLIELLGHDSLFDSDTERVLTFPFHRLQELKRSPPDALDALAFEHINVYRTLFLSALQHAVYVRNLEAIGRQSLVQHHLTETGALAYRTLVLAEAIRSVPLIELERREIVSRDEKLRFDGLVMWFRQRRVEIVSGVPLVPDTYDDCAEELEEQLAMLSVANNGCNPAAAASKPGMIGGASSTSPQDTYYHSKRVKLEELEKQMQHVNRTLRTRCVALVEKWSHDPPPSTIRESPAVKRFSAKKKSETDTRRHDRASQQHARSGSSSQHSARGRSHSPSKQVDHQHALWLPAGRGGATTHSALAIQPKVATSEQTANPVIVREHLHYDPFRTTSSASLTSVGHPHHVGGSGSASHRSSSANLIPCEIERTVRLKKLTPKGSFSSMRFCAASEATTRYVPAGAE